MSCSMDAPGTGSGERETLSQGLPGGADPERFLKQDRNRRGPIQAERRVRDFVKQVQVLDRRVIEAVGHADAGFTRAAKDFAQNPVRESG